MLSLGFWVSLPPDADFDAACADIAETRADRIFPLVEGYGADDVARFVRACHSQGMEFHAWTMNNMVNAKTYPREFLEAHRDWLAVNRNGDTGLEFPLWGRQTWWCPNSVEYLDHYVRRWIPMLVEAGADGLHLDFIRYPDIWDYEDGRAIERPEMPEYSFCYCAECRRRFKAEVGVDPMDVPLDPANDLYLEWRRWRMESITREVRLIKENLDPGLKLSAAVFPTPDIARTVVLQDWPSFADQLDFLCTMIYHQKQWGRPITWVKQAAEEGLDEIKGKCGYFAGFGYPIRQTLPEELRTGVVCAAEAGTDGVVVFSYPGPTPEQMAALREGMGNG